VQAHITPAWFLAGPSRRCVSQLRPGCRPAAGPGFLPPGRRGRRPSAADRALLHGGHGLSDGCSGAGRHPHASSGCLAVLGLKWGCIFFLHLDFI